MARDAAAPTGPIGHLREAVAQAARETRDGVGDVARKTGRAAKEAAYEGADGIVGVVKDAAKNAVRKVAAALNEAVGEEPPRKTPVGR